MKIDTRITQRDKKLLLFLAILLLVVGFAVFLFIPLTGQIQKEGESWRQQQQLQRENVKKIRELSPMRATNKRLRKDLKKAVEGFYDGMSSHEIDQLLTNQMLKDGLTAKQLKITMPIEDLTLDSFVPASVKNQEESTQGDAKDSKELFPCISSVQVHLSVSGSSKNLQSFVETLIQESPSIRVTSLQFYNGAIDAREKQADLDIGLDIYMLKV
jgi:hypothetical protein